mmetsp:Transcript_14072/g.18428  ORF Transcript_14072/g.18428 Transcript_14072/m.18428 type:complete len:492 (-) Transcript_14072:1093-2568(-)
MEAPPPPAARRVCSFCSLSFPSRNLLFKHLRDDAESCGKDLALEKAKISLKKNENGEGEKKEKPMFSQSAKKRQRPSKWGDESSAFTSAPDQEIWLGNLLPDFCQVKKLRNLLWTYGPRKNCGGENNTPVTRGEVKKLVRRGYKVRDEHTKKKSWRGFAIIAYSSAEMAQYAMKHYDGVKVKIKSPRGKESNCDTFFELKAKPANPPRKRNRGANGLQSKCNSQKSENEHHNIDWNKQAFAGTGPTASMHEPSLMQQLSPLSTAELQRRYLILGKGESVGNLNAGESGTLDREFLLERLCHLYTVSSGSRKEIPYNDGSLIPADLQRSLLTTLSNLRWPPKRHRRKVIADHYLVIWKCKHKETYPKLHALTEELMRWADSSWNYTHVAVTKNFIGSPHIDAMDSTFQHAVSLGDFTSGGELCVEGEKEDGSEVYIVQTKNKIVRVDGRYVHWVRSHAGGDRYSLIFFNTGKLESEGATKREKAVHSWNVKS